MIPFGQTALDILAASAKRIRWLWDIDTGAAVYHWSTQETNWNLVHYDFKVDPSSFSGVRMQRARLDTGAVPGVRVSFCVSNPGNAIAAADLLGATVTLRLAASDFAVGAELLTWRLEIESVTAGPQSLSIVCRDFLSGRLDGLWPDTRLVADLAPAQTPPPDVPVCVPEVVGEAFIPLRPIFHAGQWHYVLGKAGPAYTVAEVRSPRQVAKSSWLAGDGHTFAQSTITIDSVDYRVMRPIIADSDGDGIADACGLWRDGQTRLDCLCRFSRSDTASLTNPADVIEWFLLRIGIDASLIDTGPGSSFEQAAAVYSQRGITWSGGWYTRRQRAAALAELLAQCASTIDVRDKIYLRPLDVTPVASIDRAAVCRRSNGRSTWSYNPVTTRQTDAGYAGWQEAGEPADRLLPLLVGTGPAITNPSSIRIDMPLLHDQDHVARAGMLYYQRRLDQAAMPSWRSPLRLLAVQPDDAVTIAHADYGGTYTVVIDQVTVRRDGVLEFRAIQFSSTLANWEDLVPATPAVAPEDTGGDWAPVYSGPEASVVSAGEQPGRPFETPAGARAKADQAEANAKNYADANFVTTVAHQEDIDNLQNQIDGNITTWFYDGVPTLSNAPANTWTTDTEKDNHLGDLYYDNLTGYGYRFAKSSGVYQWLRITDSDVTKALADAAAAQDTADQKRRVFVATPTPPYDVGDLWDAGGTPRVIKRCVTAKADGAAYDAADWVEVATKGAQAGVDLLSSGGTTLGDADVITSQGTSADTSAVSGLPASNVAGWAHGTDPTKIDGGTIYAATITGTQIAGDTITANHIAAGTITGNEIAGNTITAGNIAAGTITANEIAANAISTSHIQADAITTAKLAANSVSTAKIQAGAVTSAEIAANAVTATHIASNTITANEIAAGTITGTEIAANTITASHLSVSQLSAIAADLGTVNAGSIVLGGGTANQLWLNESGDGSLAIGGTNKASAPFRVTAAGALTATNANITGTVTTSNLSATGGVIGGWSITANSLSKGGLTLDSANTRIRATSGSSYVELSANGLTGYSNTFGTTFNIPADGSKPTFSSGVIKEAEYQIYTSGVIRTSATVGDGSVDSAGVIINSSGIYGYPASSTTPTFSLDAATGQLTATGANISGTITITGGSGYTNLSDRPTSLSAINPSEGSKLSGIETGATKGAPAGTPVGSTDAATVEANAAAGATFTSSDAGALATKDAVDLATGDVLNKSADHIAESATRKWAGESGATVGAKAGTNLKKSDGTVLSDADVVTSLGTSADTSKVAGTAATTVRDGANRANAGLNSSGQVKIPIIGSAITGSPQTGLNMTSGGIGYWNGTDWTSAILSDGSGRFASGKISWDTSGNLTISGGKVETRSSSARIVLDPAGDGTLSMFDTTAERLRLGTEGGVRGLHLYDTSGNLLATYGDTGLKILRGGDLVIEGWDGTNRGQALIAGAGAISGGVTDVSITYNSWFSPPMGGGRLYLGYDPNTANSSFDDIYIKAATEIHLEGAVTSVLDKLVLRPSVGAPADIGVTTAGNIYLTSPTTQLRYDTANYCDFAVDSAGNLTISPTGSLIKFSSTARVAFDASNYADFAVNSAGVLTISSTSAEVTLPTTVNIGNDGWKIQHTTNYMYFTGADGTSRLSIDTLSEKILVIKGAVSLNKRSTTPAATSWHGTIYVDASGYLKYLSPSGNIRTLANP